MQSLPKKSQLRSFGTTVGGIFVLIGLWPFLRRGQNVRLLALALGSILVLGGLVAPMVLRKPYQVWMKIGGMMGWINTRIILSVTYYLVFTPSAVIMRWIGKDPMNRTFLPSSDTYRVLRQRRSPSHMKHQF